MLIAASPSPAGLESSVLRTITDDKSDISKHLVESFVFLKTYVLFFTKTSSGLRPCSRRAATWCSLPWQLERAVLPISISGRGLYFHVGPLLCGMELPGSGPQGASLPRRPTSGTPGSPRRVHRSWSGIPWTAFGELGYAGGAPSRAHPTPVCDPSGR